MIAAAVAALLFAACPESALNCITLFPTPDLAASGSIALLPPQSPFGVAVTADGRTRHHLVATIAGLPDPRALGVYTAYVAWAYTLSLDSATKLGEVRNGRVDLGELVTAQFRILISAEQSGAVKSRAGRLVLRGTSPSARLLAHRDLVQPSAPGALVDSVPRAPAMASMGGMPHAVGAWAMPPMPGRMASMPGMTGLVPATSPFLPDIGRVADTGGSVAAATVRLADGDTLVLESRTMARTIAGKRILMFGYNGRTPGPLIDVAQGANVVIRFHNGIDAPSSVHWHGIRLDNQFDGAVGLTQDAVPARGWFTYSVRFPDPGIYWYHPHVREDLQQALGLYGNVLVRSRVADYLSPVNREAVLTVSDLLIGDGGATPFGADVPTHALMGRFGNTFLVNGEANYALDVNRGDVVRFFLTNVSSARPYNLSFAGAGARMKVVAGDGGKLEREQWVQSIVIAPAERYVVDVEFAQSGAATLVNRVQALDHMIGSYSPEVDTLASIRVGARPARTTYATQFNTLRTNADVSSDLARFRKYFDKPVDHTLVLTLRTRNLPAAISNMLIGVNAPIEWNDGMSMMNWLTTGREVEWVVRDSATGKENMDIAWRFRRGDVVKLRVFNDPSTNHAMAHPIHLHGQRFLVLARDGVRNENLGWKDTAIVPAGQSVDLLVEMSNPGRWMLHCHIAEHLSAGMMAAFTVE